MKSWKLYCIGLSSILIISCQDEFFNNEAQFLQYKVPSAVTNINSGKIYVDFLHNTSNAQNIIPEFEVSMGATVELNGVTQISNISSYNFESPFTYEVISEDNQTSMSWTVIPQNNNYTLSYGLGGFQKENVSNNRKYNFYIDQKNTGIYSAINCGPTVATMAIKWYNQNFSKTTEYARNQYGEKGGWWSVGWLHSYLNDNKIPHYFVKLSENSDETKYIIQKKIQEGNVLILCLDMYYLSECVDNNWHVDKFYQADTKGWGHFILIKGYKIVDKKFYLEVYDPNSWGRTYDDGTFKGKDRYYQFNEIVLSAKNWWNYGMVISSNNLKSDNLNTIPFNQIPEAKGK